MNSNHSTRESFIYQKMAAAHDDALEARNTARKQLEKLLVNLDDEAKLAISTYAEAQARFILARDKLVRAFPKG